MSTRTGAATLAIIGDLFDVAPIIGESASFAGVTDAAVGPVMQVIGAVGATFRLPADVDHLVGVWTETRGSIDRGARRFAASADLLEDLGTVTLGASVLFPPLAIPLAIVGGAFGVAAVFARVVGRAHDSGLATGASGSAAGARSSPVSAAPIRIVDVRSLRAAVSQLEALIAQSGAAIVAERQQLDPALAAVEGALGGSGTRVDRSVASSIAASRNAMQQAIAALEASRQALRRYGGQV